MSRLPSLPIADELVNAGHVTFFDWSDLILKKVLPLQRLTP